MSRIRDRHTVPEMLLRRSLWRAGFRYRLRPKLPGWPDIAFPRERLLVFADGCLWHGCPEHYVQPKTRVRHGSPKIQGNVERDRRHDASLRAEGWTVVRLWEHEIEADPLDCAHRVAKLLQQVRSAKQ